MMIEQQPLSLDGQRGSTADHLGLLTCNMCMCMHMHMHMHMNMHMHVRMHMRMHMRMRMRMVHGWYTHVHGLCVHHACSRIPHNIAVSATQRPRWRASLARSASSSTRMAASYRWRPRVALVSTAIVATRPGSTRGVRPRAQVLHSRHSTCTHMRMHMCT